MCVCVIRFIPLKNQVLFSKCKHICCFSFHVCVCVCVCVCVRFIPLKKPRGDSGQENYAL